MARDYARGSYQNKGAKKRKPKKTAASRTTKKTTSQKPKTLFIIGGFLCVGVLLGALITGLIFLSHHNASPTASKTPTKPVVAKQRQKSHKAKPTNKPHFAFYTILPNKEIDTPHPAQDDGAPAQTQSEFILQVASVKQYQDADRLRAQLLLLGYEVFISKSESGKIPWYRVNLGPFTTLNMAEKKQDELRKNHVDSLLLKRTKA